MTRSLKYDDVVEIRDEVAEDLKTIDHKIERMNNGERLCNHSFNNADDCWDTYCTGCGIFCGEIRTEFGIPPLESDCYCVNCQKTDEEKQREREEREQNEREREINKLRQLKQKYPDVE